MTDKQVQDLLLGQLETLRAMGIRFLAVFGSVAQGTSGPDSDVDLLVGFSRPVGLFEFVRLKGRLEEILGRPVDLVTPDALRTSMRPQRLDEAVNVIPQLALRISDILDGIARISRYTAGMILASFAADEKTVDAVLRKLEIIGEAARNLPDDCVARYPQIPWHEMRGMRNILVYEYSGVSLQSVATLRGSRQTRLPSWTLAKIVIKCS